MQLRRHGRPYKLLRCLFLVGGFMLISTISPASGASIVNVLIKAYFRKKRFEKEKFLRDLKSLQKRDLLNYQELGNGDVKITLTKLGKKKALFYNIDEIKLDTSSRWDKSWRLVMFDIPHSYKKARDAFRGKLRDLRFYQLQKSVFITPYKCENEIDFISSVFDVRKYVLVLYVKKFEGEEKLRHYFRLD